MFFSYNGKKWTLGELRHNQFMQMAATSKSVIKPQNLPPTERAAYYHCLRIHLQVVEWNTLNTVALAPTDWGWKLSSQGRF
jgi:hypothetical protein